MKLSAVLSDIGEVVAPFNNGLTIQRFAHLSGEPLNKVHDVFLGRGLPTLDKYESGEISTDEFQKIVCSRLNMQKTLMPTRDEFNEAYSDVFVTRPEVIAEWRRLRTQGVIMGALSNICEMRYLWLEKMGVFDCFDHEILSYVEGLRKPSKELMVRSLDRLGANASETLFVDDLAPNLVPAAELGIVTHHFTGVENFLEFIRDLGV